MLASRARRGVRRVALAGMVALVAGTAGTASADIDGAVAASSWQTSRTEEFTQGSLPRGCGTYGGPYAGGKSYWTPDDVKLSGGLLHLKLQQRNVRGFRWTSGGVGCWGWAQRYGRYEVRAKVPAGRGIDSYLTLWPSKGSDGSTGVELLAPGPETAYVTNGFGGGTDTARIPGRYSDGFHTYVIEWAPSLTRISVDDRVIYSTDKSYDGSRWLGMVVSNGDALTGVPDATTTLPAEFQIDYVKVSSFTGVTPAPRSTVARPSRDRPASVPATTASVLSGAKAPPSTPPPVAGSAAAATPEPAVESQGTALAGGVWPWLIGGILIAALAVATLGRPRVRRPGR